MIGCIATSDVVAACCAVTRRSAPRRLRTLRARGRPRREPRVPRARHVVRSAGRRLLQALHPRRAQRAQRAGGDRRRAASSASPARSSPTALAKFLGVDRRFQILGDYHGAHRRRRLRAPPDRDPRHARRGAQRLSRPPHRRALPAASLLAHARLRARVRRGAAASPTCRSSRRSTRRASSRSTACPRAIISDAVPGIEFLDRSNARDRQRNAPPSAARTTSSSPWAPATCTRSPSSS